MKLLTLVVEDQNSQEIVQRIFIAANYPVEKIDFVIADGKNRASVLADISVMLKKNKHTALLLDSDKQTIPDAVADEPAAVNTEGLNVFFAVPEIESWLFADINLLERQGFPSEIMDTINRLPLPEEIPYPRQLAHSLLRKFYVKNDNHVSAHAKNKKKINRLNFDFLADINVSKAASRSFSLNFFLNGIAKLLNLENDTIENVIETIPSNIDRKIFSNLLREVLPSTTIVFKSLDGRKVSASEMLNNIEEDSPLARQYTSDLLRISRDFLKRQANK